MGPTGALQRKQGEGLHPRAKASQSWQEMGLHQISGPKGKTVPWAEDPRLGLNTQDLSMCTSPGHPTDPHYQARGSEDPYQFFKTRVVIRAAMTMMRETVMVMI